MSIATELQNLNDNILSAYDAVETKGGTVPTNKNTANLNSAIRSISTVYETTSTTGVFYTDIDAPLKKLLVNITPIQSGSGTPSPTNVRPISGHTSVSVTVSPTATPSDGTTYTTALGRTVYGGTLDVLSGELTVDRQYLTVSDFSLWGGDNVSAGGLHWVNVPTRYPAALAGNGNICSHAEYLEGGNGWLSRVPAYSVAGSFPARIYVASNSYADFQTEYADLQAVYMLATPQTYQLTPQQINTLMGNNTLTVDGGEVMEVIYLSHSLPSGYQADTDLVACHRSSDDALGIYDLVNNVFTPMQAEAVS